MGEMAARPAGNPLIPRKSIPARYLLINLRPLAVPPRA